MVSNASWALTVICDESGVTAIEYGLLAALIAVAAIVAISNAGGAVGAMFDYWSGAVRAALAGAGGA